jgi:choloylglycine hydrolase
MMKFFGLRRLGAALALGTMLATPAVAPACTGILLTAGDGSAVTARTLEFGTDLMSNVLISPRGFVRTGTTPDGQPGLTWKAKYASVGANGMGLPVIIDGVNERGLTVGLFYFSGYAGYMPYAPAQAKQSLASYELASYLLDNFASVAEVRAGLDKIVVPAVVLKAMNMVLDVHFMIHDAAGNSLVVEYVGGKLTTHDAPLGVMTNNPTYDWHMTNLSNYVNMSMTNVDQLKLRGATIKPLGLGSGMLGLPGDFTPPSRFVRAVAYSQSVLPSATGDAAVLTAFHILNQFDIPKGSARDGAKDANGNIIADYTLWTSATDTRTKRYYFRTFQSSQIRMVDLMKANLDAPGIVTISMQGDEVIKPLN